MQRDSTLAEVESDLRGRSLSTAGSGFLFLGISVLVVAVLLGIGLAADSSELTRIVMTDPRLVRVEALRGESDLSFRRLYRPSVDFSFLVFDKAVVSIRVLKPRWDGSKWLFDVLAEARIE